MLKISTNNAITINGQSVGLSIAQTQKGTVVYTPESKISGTAYKEHAMPHQRYSLTHDDPASGAAGRHQFEADVLALIETL